MKMGENADWDEDKFISNEVVLEKIPGLIEVERSGAAKRYILEGYKGSIGLISPISSCFVQTVTELDLQQTAS